MKKRLRFFSYLTLVLLTLSSIWVVFNFTMHQLLQPKVVALEPLGDLEKWTNLIWFGYMVFFVVHIIALLTYIFHLQLFRDINLVKIAQYVGVICGLLGLAMISMQLVLDVPMWHIRSFGMITVVLLLIPYGLVVGYWMLIKSKEKISEWYDEKQWMDVSRAGFITLILSVLAMILIFILNIKSLPGGVFGILWFPFYLFFVLFVFSFCVLVFTNKS